MNLPYYQLPFLKRPLGMSVWWKDHADHHMPALLDPNGPFRGCNTERGHNGDAEPLPTLPAPEAFFPDERELVPAGPAAETDDEGDE